MLMSDEVINAVFPDALRHRGQKLKLIKNNYYRQSLIYIDSNLLERSFFFENWDHRGKLIEKMMGNKFADIDCGISLSPSGQKIFNEIYPDPLTGKYGIGGTDLI